MEKEGKEKVVSVARRTRPAAPVSGRGALTRRMLTGMADVTQILSAIGAGDPKAAAELLPLVYDELRKLAAARLT